MLSKIKILKRKLLHKNFVFIDGIAKSGKIVVSTIISSLKNCENQTYADRFNNYLKFKNLGLLDEDLSIDLILQEMQTFMLEGQLSRFLNFRKYDLSSVNNSLLKKDYYKRLKKKDNESEIEKVIKQLNKNKKIMPLIVDDFFPNCLGKFTHFYNYKKIIILRNPISILYENLIRSRVDKQIKAHPWQTSVFHYQYSNKKIPWFVEPKDVNKFFSSNRIEKYLMFMNSEYKPYLKKKVFKIKKTQFFFIEDIWSKPGYAVNLISKFLKSEVTNHTKKILKVLDLPRANINENYEKEFYYLKNKMTKSEFRVILNLEKSYKIKKEIYGFK
jgi:hypothetical protein